jgi:hypothetical protein
VLVLRRRAAVVPDVGGTQPPVLVHINPYARFHLDMNTCLDLARAA